jgi:hypothetical protein
MVDRHRPPRRLRVPDGPEPLEPRRPLAGRLDAAIDALQLVGVDHIRLTTTIQTPPGTGGVNWTMRLYRSADATLDSSDVALGEWTLAADQPGDRADGLPVTRTHDLALAEPFRIVPRRPYVIAAIDPDGLVSESDEANNTAVARRHSVVVVTHGGFQETDDGDVPAWQKRLGRELAAQGYDDVLLYNWVGESKIAGALRKQPGRLVHRLAALLAEIPPGEPVDVHFLGHSQGTVINGLAQERLAREPLPALAGGVIQSTLLDPHAADNGAPLRQYSTRPSFLGWVARTLVNDYQGRARDPAPRVPSNVHESVVYYQHTYYAFAEHEDQRLLNLWGQVPVRGAARYIDITGPGISHSGYYSVVDWYREHVLPGLGDGGRVLPPILTAGLAPASGRIDERRPARGHIGETDAMHTTLAAPSFEGQSWPGARVRLTAAPVGVVTDRPATLGVATADATGRWSITSRDLPRGRFTLIASAVIDASAAHPRVKMTPRIRVGQLSVQPLSSSRRG